LTLERREHTSPPRRRKGERIANAEDREDEMAGNGRAGEDGTES
jgi:hypothetical protein